MPRVKRGTKARSRRKKVLKKAKGYFGARSKLFRPANETVMRALKYAYEHRRLKKRDFRRLWIMRINAAARKHELSYSRFIHGLKLANVKLNRKILADIAVNDQQAFSSLVETARSELDAA